MHHRGARPLASSTEPQLVLHAIEQELSSRGARGLQRLERSVIVQELVVASLSSPSYRITNLSMSVDASTPATRVDYEATAEVKYTWHYIARLLFPVALVAGFSVSYSPLVLIAAPIGYTLLQLTYRTFLPMWLEEVAHKVEQRTRNQASSSGA